MAGELQQILAELAGLRESNKSLGREIGEIKQVTRGLDQKIGEVRETNSRIDATLDAFINQDRGEKQALFEARNEHERRLSGIETNYVNKAACGEKIAAKERSVAKVEAQVAEQGRTIVSLQKTEAKAVMAASIVSLAISAAGWVLKYWK